MRTRRIARPARRCAQARGRMNGTERAYAIRLEAMKASGDVIHYAFEAVKLRLADRTWYTPDFLVVTPDRIEFHEVKGHWEDDARVKWKVAAEQFSWAAFAACRLVGGQWEIEWYGKEEPCRG